MGGGAARGDSTSGAATRDDARASNSLSEGVRAATERTRPPRSQEVLLWLELRSRKTAAQDCPWYDGFVIALATPGSLLGSLGYSVGDIGGWGSVLLCGHLRRARVLHHDALRRDGGDVPGQAGRLPAVCARGLAKVLHARRPGRGLRLLARLVGRARVPRRVRRARSSPFGMVPGRAVRERVLRELGGRGLLLDRRGRDRPAAPHRHRAHPRSVALQHPWHSRRGRVRLSRRRAAHGATLRVHGAPVPERRLRQRQSDLGSSRRHGRSRSQATSVSTWEVIGSRSSGSGSWPGRPGESTPARRSRPSTRTPSTTRSSPSAPRASSRSSSTRCSRSASSAASARRRWPHSTTSERSRR